MAATNPPQPVDLHRNAIAELADELECDRELVADVYLREVDGLTRSARLPEFIPILAAKHTRERLRRHSRR